MADRVICIMGRVLDQDDGLGVYSTNLLQELFLLDGTSRYIILLRTPQNANLFQHFENVETQVIPTKVKLLWDQWTVPIAAKRCGADILFNPKFSLPLFSSAAGVFVLHGADWYINPQNYKWWDNLYIRLMMPIYCHKAKRLLAISQCIVNDLVKHAHIDPAKATVSYAAPSPHFSPQGDEQCLAEFQRRYSLPERFILTVARAYHTGHARLPPYPGGNNERLLQGYRRYRAQGGVLPLVVVGQRIEEYLRARGFGDNDLADVRFTGFIPHAEIHKAYQSAEFFVLATLYESFAFPLVEAMASGCPAVVPATGACPEVAGGAAMLIDPYDPEDIAKAMMGLDAAQEKRQQLKAAGLERVKTFTWRETAKRTLSVFDSIVAPNPATDHKRAVQ